MQGTCRDCLSPYRFDETYYDSRGLTWPSRCHGCRQQRKAARVQGQIVGLNPDKERIYLTSDQGEAFLARRSDLGREADIAILRIGARVSFLPMTEIEAGHRFRRARRLQVEEGS